MRYRHNRSRRHHRGLGLFVIEGAGIFAVMGTHTEGFGYNSVINVF